MIKIIDEPNNQVILTFSTNKEYRQYTKRKQLILRLTTRKQLSLSYMEFSDKVGYIGIVPVIQRYKRFYSRNTNHY